MFIGAIAQTAVAFGGEIKRSVASNEVREAIDMLVEASHIYGSEFDLIKEQIEEIILVDTKKFIDAIQSGRSVRKYIYSTIANISGDMVESGNYHIYRGVLNPHGPGEKLLEIFDAAMDELVNLGDTDFESSRREKEAIRENIKAVG